MKRHIFSRFFQSPVSAYNLSELAQCMAAFYFNCRTVHFNTSGKNFLEVHEYAQELYEQAEDYYDDLVETAISLNENPQPMFVTPGAFELLNQDTFSPEQSVEKLSDNVKRLFDIFESANKEIYPSFVYSKLDSIMEWLDKQNYKLERMRKTEGIQSSRKMIKSDFIPKRVRDLLDYLVDNFLLPVQDELEFERNAQEHHFDKLRQLAYKLNKADEKNDDVAYKKVINEIVRLIKVANGDKIQSSRKAIKSANGNSIARAIEKETGLSRSKKEFDYVRDSGDGNVAYRFTKAPRWKNGDFHIEKYYQNAYDFNFDNANAKNKKESVIRVLENLGCANIVDNTNRGFIRFDIGKEM